MSLVNTIAKKAAIALILGASTLGFAGAAHADAKFQRWINGFYTTAAQNGISKKTYQRAFAGVTDPDPVVLQKANYQPEFTSEVWDYVDSHVNPYTVRIGREMAVKYASTLTKLEKRFGIERQVLLAIWSMESSYGAVLENSDRLHYVPRALATLAYADPKRSKYAKTQLIAALKILQNGDVSAKGLTGSWAGAMGHTQFIPTSYLLYAVDEDGNGHRDIWNSIPDALATSANLLSKNGWESHRTWGYEVAVPRSMSKYEGQTKTLAQWASLGLSRPNGKGFGFADDRAVLKMPAGSNGPGFLMVRNFFVIKKYNAADKYALAVGLLADEIAGYGGMQQRWPRPAGTLDVKQKFELQTRMKELGYYDGEVDGNIGSGSRAAIAAIQNRLGLTADGEPSERLLNALRR